jgi:hypothetical protein
MGARRFVSSYGRSMKSAAALLIASPTEVAFLAAACYKSSETDTSATEPGASSELAKAT